MRAVNRLWLGVAGLTVAVAVAGALTARADARAEADENVRLLQRLTSLEQRMERQEAVHDIENLTRAYGYYVDKQLWDQVYPLFTSDCRIEIAGRGVYLNAAGAKRLFLDSMGGGKVGLGPGMLFNHIILQGVVNVSADGNTAKGRYRAVMQIGKAQAFAVVGEGTYENVYRKEDGIWKISEMHFYSTYYTPYTDGWGKVNMPNNGPDQAAGPDLPQSVDYDVLPGHYVPPFHYPNPVTGKPWTLEDSRKYSTHGMSPKPLVPGAQSAPSH